VSSPFALGPVPERSAGRAVDAVVDPATGARTVTTVVEVGTGPHFVWLAAVDRDGVPSRLSGAYRLPPRTS